MSEGKFDLVDQPEESRSAENWRQTPNPDAPLPVGIPQAIRIAYEHRMKGVPWSWPVIAQVIGAYHGIWRSPGWWAANVKETYPRLPRRPRGHPMNGSRHGDNKDYIKQGEET